jgi:uroporphyrinogen-III synthase
VTKYVLITRHPTEAREFHALLQPHGFAARAYPVLRVTDVDDTEGWRGAHAMLEDRPRSLWVVISSPRAPERMVRQARERGADRLLTLPVATVGDATAQAAAKAGLHAELVGPGSGFGLAKELLPLLEPEVPVIFVCGEHSRPELPETLVAAGHHVQRVEVYGMEPTPVRELPALGPDLAAVVVTSPRSARLYLEGVGGRPLPLPHWALGPTTRAAAEALGIECRIPSKQTLESLAEAICTT